MRCLLYFSSVLSSLPLSSLLLSTPLLSSFAKLDHLLAASLGVIAHRLEAGDQLVAVEQQRRTRVEPEPVLVALPTTLADLLQDTICPDDPPSCNHHSQVIT